MDSARIQILGEELKAQVGNFRCVVKEFETIKFDGTRSGLIQNFVFERGDSVAALIHLLATDEIILVEQIRVATLGHSDGLLLEIPAGRIDHDELPSEAVRREVFEEVGVQREAGECIATFFPSPGACSEFIHLFYMPIHEELSIESFGGLESEHEDIKTHRINVREFLRMADDRELVDGKSLIAAMWLKNRTA